MSQQENEIMRAILCAVMTPEQDENEIAVSLGELERLLETAGGELFAQVIQARQNPDNATYLGKGKIEEIGHLCRDHDVHLVICDDELSPAQIKNMEDALSDAIGDEEFEIRVIDRSMLILDIFALHAVSGEGKLQVELAQLRYSVPRLYGKGKSMSRLGGGIGTRGPGESQLEKDRRHIKRRILALEEQLAELVKSRAVRRSRRDNSGVFRASIVGYTNAGKSTLLNRLTDAGILAEDKLFATLDTTTRKFELPSGREMLLTDTVGFIRNLPHHLIEAFKSTLEEAKYTDALIIVIDASDPECVSQLEVTEKLLYDLGVTDKPTLYVLNKCDIAMTVPEELTARANKDRVIPISALDGRGVSALVEALEALAVGGRKMYCLKVPTYEMGVINKLYNLSMIEDVEYFDGYARVIATMDEKTAGQLRRFIVLPKKQDDEENS
ncbi:MAG: GTPase HflX [Clostridia bacterium]|nr:GTPase HflX [Clostridia bacterium]